MSFDNHKKVGTVNTYLPGQRCEQAEMFRELEIAI